MCIAAVSRQTHRPRPPRRSRRPQHAFRPQSGRCAARVPRRDDTVVKCRRCVVVSGAGVTSYDRRWCWCRHAHTFSRYAPAPNLHICLLRRHLQIMTYTVCADRRQRGQPTALSVRPSDRAVKVVRRGVGRESPHSLRGVRWDSRAYSEAEIVLPTTRRTSSGSARPSRDGRRPVRCRSALNR